MWYVPSGITYCLGSWTCGQRIHIYVAKRELNCNVICGHTGSWDWSKQIKLHRVTPENDATVILPLRPGNYEVGRCSPCLAYAVAALPGQPSRIMHIGHDFPLPLYLEGFSPLNLTPTCSPTFAIA